MKAGKEPHEIGERFGRKLFDVLAGEDADGGRDLRPPGGAPLGNDYHFFGDAGRGRRDGGTGGRGGEEEREERTQRTGGAGSIRKTFPVFGKTFAAFAVA